MALRYVFKIGRGTDCLEKFSALCFFWGGEYCSEIK
jgi:hypothetical protein